MKCRKLEVGETIPRGTIYLSGVLFSLFIDNDREIYFVKGKIKITKRLSKTNGCWAKQCFTKVMS